MLDIPAHFILVQLPQARLNRYSLPQLLAIRRFEPLGQRWLPGQNHLEQLLLRHFEVREKPDLFENRRRDPLRLIKNQQQPLAVPIAVERQSAQQPAALEVAAARRQPQVLQNRRDHLLSGLRRVKDESDFRPVLPSPQQVLEQGSLAQPWPGDQDLETPALRQPIMQRGGGLGVLGAEIEEAGVRRGAERLLAKSKVFQKHIFLLTRRA